MEEPMEEWDDSIQADLKPLFSFWAQDYSVKLIKLKSGHKSFFRNLHVGK